MNDIFQREAVNWSAYGESSVIHIYMGSAPAAFDPLLLSREQLHTAPPDLVRQLRLALMLNGVDISGGPTMLTNTALSADDIAFTLDAFAKSLNEMKKDQLI